MKTNYLPFATAGAIMLTCSVASAQIISAGASTSASVGGLRAGAAARSSADLTQVISRSDSEISARLAALSNLSARVQGLKNVSDSAKANVSAQVSANTSGLSSLKAKIDADADPDAAQTDEKTIANDYRIYALVIPQGYILAASDRAQTIGGLMTNLASKMQTRIAAAQSSGANVSSMTSAMADLQAKVSDSNVQAQASESGAASLKPDGGDSAVAQSNRAALVASRGDLKTSESDLKAARADIAKVLQGLKGTKASASASAAVSPMQ